MRHSVLAGAFFGLAATAAAYEPPKDSGDWGCTSEKRLAITELAYKQFGDGDENAIPLAVGININVTFASDPFPTQNTGRVCEAPDDCHSKLQILHGLVRGYKNVTYHDDGHDTVFSDGIAEIGGSFIPVIYDIHATGVAKFDLKTCSFIFLGPTYYELKGKPGLEKLGDFLSNPIPSGSPTGDSDGNPVQKLTGTVAGLTGSKDLRMRHLNSRAGGTLGGLTDSLGGIGDAGKTLGGLGNLGNLGARDLNRRIDNPLDGVLGPAKDLLGGVGGAGGLPAGLRKRHLGRRVQK